ncbi:MAG: hypothetical protein FWF81_05015 [Defluviitaleaceae bacterium]|nr:hypothetical protein [Defluviitaleaceae bacterium]
MYQEEQSYTLRMERDAEGNRKYYLLFRDGQARNHKTEVPRKLYGEILLIIRKERNLCRKNERWLTKFELTEEEIHAQAVYRPKDLPEILEAPARTKRLEQTIAELSEIQRRRFILYREHGLTLERIAEIEGCTKMPVKRSIDRAEEKIREKLQNLKKIRATFGAKMWVLVEGSFYPLSESPFSDGVRTYLYN